MTKTPYPYSKNGKKAIAKAKKIEKNAVKKPITKIDKNRIYAWILLVLMAFWTFASVVSLVYTFGGKSSMSTISAGAEGVDYNQMTIDPFQYPTANLLNWPYADGNRNIDGVDFIVNDNGTLTLNGTCSYSNYTSFSVNTHNDYFFGGADYVLSTYLLDGQVNIPNTVVMYLACKLQDGTTQTLAGGSRIGTSIPFTVPQNASFLFLVIYFARSNVDITCENATIGIMYNQGSTSYPYQPPYQLVYENGYNVGTEDGFDGGYQEGLTSAKYSFWQTLLVRGTMTVYDNISGVETELPYAGAPYNLLYTGVDLSPLKSYFQQMVPNGKTFVSVDIIFNFDRNAVLLGAFKINAYGSSDLFSIAGRPITYRARTINPDNTYNCTFVQSDNAERGVYVLTYEDSTSIDFGGQVDSFGAFTVNNLDSLTGFKLVSSNSGYVDGFNAGLASGKKEYINSQEYNDYIASIKEQAYKNGQSVGFSEGLQNANDYSFFGLLSSVVDAPLAMFQDMFNFEILGVNLSNFALGLLTLAIVLGVVKLIF